MDPMTSWRSVVAIAAHPDDVESWCGGTLALAADAGARVEVLIATSGEAGTSTIDTLALAELREAEARMAAQHLGIAAPYFLRCPDGGLARSETLTERCRSFVDGCRPDLVLTFDPDRPWSVTPHPDHTAVGRAVLAAAPRDGAATVWLFSTADPDVAVDIGPTFDRKLLAREAHGSQTSDLAQLRTDWRCRAADTGELAGVPLAEAFRRQ